MGLLREELEVLVKIAKILAVDEPISVLLNKVLDILSHELNLERGIITVVEKDAGAKVEVVHSPQGESKKDVVYKLGEGVIGKVAETGVPAVIPDIGKEPKFLNKTGIRKKIEGISFICVPIKYKGDVIGTISVDYSSHDKQDLKHILEFMENVADILSGIIYKYKLEDENKRLKHLFLEKDTSVTIIGSSDKMKEVQLLIYEVAPTPTTVLIIGETGTGKELVARAIHDLSPRCDKPFIAINCGAIPPNLIESELFGYEKGAFTGAYKTTKGKFEAANGGTIFLDEVGELHLEAQAKLLRVLEERVIYRVGSYKGIPIDVRIIAATNRVLEEEVKKGNFREDLYYRLNVFPIYLPPLRERGADIILLANYFISKYNTLLGKNVRRIDTPAIDMLVSYHWPGNVRELQNTIERAMILTDEDVIRAHHLPPTLQMKSQDEISKPRGKLKILLENYEKELIIDALKDANGNQSEAARLLGTTKRVIQYAIQKYNIDYKRFKKKS